MNKVRCQANVVSRKERKGMWLSRITLGVQVVVYFVFVLAIPHTVNAQSWNLTGNAGTNPANNFLGTTDNQPLRILTNGVETINISPGQIIPLGNVGFIFPGTVSFFGLNVNFALNANVRGQMTTRTLQITGGGDLSELFEITGSEAIKPGMVVAIDPDQPGHLRIANKAYDRTVGGIVSGANGINPGLTMKQEGTIVNGSLPVSLTGRVYCWADASYGPIEPGDSLTTSNTPGHAMKVTDHLKAQGAIIGKAMSRLETGRGLVLVLVILQ